MGDDSAYWCWRDDVLKHPEGRALGGQPCVLCSTPIPSNAYWKYRDRHVCSRKCNVSLARRFLRMKDGATTFVGHAAPARPALRANPRTRPSSTNFGMLEAPFPFDFEGYGPRPEDSITRFGSTTVYYLANLDGLISLGLTILANWQDRPVLLAHHHPTNTGALIAAERADLTPTRLRLGMLTGLNGDAEQLRFESLPKDGESLVGSDGVNYKWISETIRDARPDDTTFTWTALVCVPVWAEHPGLLWSPSYLYLSERLSRINTNTNSHARRVRKEEGVVERFAAADIFERDNWTCQLCGEGIDIALKWPNPLSASLDHILPLSAEGDHTRENSQAAHLQCNMLKGARVNTF